LEKAFFGSPNTFGNFKNSICFFLFEVLLLKSEYVRGREKSLLGRALLYGLVRLWPCGLQHVQAFACSFSSDQRKRRGRLAPDASQVRIPPLIAPNSYPAIARESSSLCRLLAGAARRRSRAFADPFWAAQ